MIYSSLEKRYNFLKSNNLKCNSYTYISGCIFIRNARNMAKEGNAWFGYPQFN